jgi:hypothetical protein
MKDLNPGYQEPGYLFIRESDDDLTGPLMPLMPFDLENWEEVHSHYKPALITHDRLQGIGFNALEEHHYEHYILKQGNSLAFIYHEPIHTAQCHYYFKTETGKLYVKYVHQVQYVLTNWYKISVTHSGFRQFL